MRPNPQKPTVSDAPLTSEQIAVYRAVLASYLNGSNGVLNLSNITCPLDRADTGRLTVGEGIAEEISHRRSQNRSVTRCRYEHHLG